MGFAYSPTVDLVGGIICCWNCARFQECSRFCDHRFVVIRGSWIAGSGPEGLTCIYAPNDLVERVEFFSSLHLFITTWGCSDFNSVLKGDERWGLMDLDKLLRSHAILWTL